MNKLAQITAAGALAALMTTGVALANHGGGEGGGRDYAPGQNDGGPPVHEGFDSHGVYMCEAVHGGTFVPEELDPSTGEVLVEEECVDKDFPS